MMNVELLEGEVLCPKCNGESVYSTLVCDKCSGEGKLDWVSLAMNLPAKRNRSVLDSINVRRMIQHIEQSIESCFLETCLEKNIENMHAMLGSHLDIIKSRHAIDDYKIEKSSDNSIDIFIKPQKTVETMNLNIKINE